MKKYTIAVAFGVILPGAAVWAAGEADLILNNGKIVTVDHRFSIAEAIAVGGERILRVGSGDEVMALRGPKTEVIDLAGQTLIPGLIDSHVHPANASIFEFDHSVPEMESIGDVLKYIQSRADALEDGQWIEVRQVFVTRLREQRFPTRGELDRAAPNNPVLFATGYDAALNSLALKLSGIDKNYKAPGKAIVEIDGQTGEPTGFIRGYAGLVKPEPTGKQPTEADRYAALKRLLADYNSVGITSIADRKAQPGDLERYWTMRSNGDLTVRVAVSELVDTEGDLAAIEEQIRSIAKHPLAREDPMLRIIGVKTFLDGGMLTGSAYMLQPWGVSDIYSIRDPAYRGVLLIPPERLQRIVHATVASGLQFTAHTVGDGAVHQLLDAYEAVNRELPIRDTRPCITHSNFMSREAIEKAARLGVVADMQPVWLYLDTRTLVAQFGYDRLRYFQPLQSLFAAGVTIGGGSDHMQKIGSLRSINPYDPFLGIWTTITRKAKDYDGSLYPEEALTREQAIRFYTINNAVVTRREQNIGSLEPGKFADFVLLDTDLLTCPVDAIRDTKVLGTWLNGKRVYGVNGKE